MFDVLVLSYSNSNKCRFKISSYDVSPMWPTSLATSLKLNCWIVFMLKHNLNLMEYFYEIYIPEQTFKVISSLLQTLIQITTFQPWYDATTYPAGCYDDRMICLFGKHVNKQISLVGYVRLRRSTLNRWQVLLPLLR